MNGTAGDSPPPTGGEAFTLVDVPQEHAQDGSVDFEREELEHLYSLFEPDSWSQDGGTGKASWEVPSVIQATRQRREEMGGELIFDKLLTLAGMDAQEYFPPSSQPAMHALLDQINSSETFDKVKKDCLVYYLLLWAFPIALFPAPIPSPSSTAAPTQARRRGDDRASRFARAEILPPSFTRTTTAYYLLDQGYHLQAIGFLSTNEENEVDFKEDILRVLRGIPDEYSDPASGQEAEKWPWGSYRAQAVSTFVDGLSIDIVGAWRTALLDLVSAEDGAASALSQERAALSNAQANLIAYAEATAFQKGPWLTWDIMVEVLPNLVEGMVVEIGLDLNDEGEAAIADQIHDAVVAMKEMLARKVWEHCFYPSPRPKAVKEMLSLPLSIDSSNLLSKIVLTPSSSLPLHLQATAADVLLVRYIEEGRYVDALRLDARLDASSIGSASSGVANDAKRATLVERRKRLVHGVRALLPAVQRKLLDVELGFDRQEEEEAEEEQEPQREGSLGMSWEDVRSKDVAVSDQAVSNKKRDTPTRSREPSRPLSASPLLRQSPHSGSDPQMAVLNAVIGSPLSPSGASTRPSEAHKQQQKRDSIGRAPSSDAPSPLAGFLARNRNPSAPRSPSPLTPSKGTSKGLNARSPFVGPPNLPIATLTPEPVFEDEPQGTMHEGDSVLGRSVFGSGGLPVGGSARASILEPPVRRYEPRFTDPAASFTPPSRMRSQSPATFVQGSGHRKRLLGEHVAAQSPGFDTSDSVMEDEIMQIPTRASKTQLKTSSRPKSAEQQPERVQPEPEDAAPVRRRFGSPARSARTSTRASASRGEPSSLRKVVKRGDEGEAADMTVPGSFPGIADKEVEENAMEVDVPRSTSKQPKASTSKATPNLRKSRSTAKSVAAATPRRQTRQQTAELGSQLGSDEEQEEPKNVPPSRSMMQSGPPVSSTPARKVRQTKTRQRRTTSANEEEDANDQELGSEATNTQTEDDEEEEGGRSEAGDTIGELPSSTRRGSRLRASGSTTGKKSGMSTRRSSRLSAASEEPEEQGAAEVETEKPKRRAARRARA